MCIILDANCFADFNDRANEDMDPVWNWLEEKNGKIVYAPTEKFEKEWEGKKQRILLKTLSNAGRLKMEDSEKVEAEANNLKGKIESDDEHIIALARVAKVSLLVSKDQKLHADFKNKDLVGGHVYQNRDHRRLLKPDTCP